MAITIKTANFKGKKEVKNGRNRGSREQLFPGTDFEANYQARQGDSFQLNKGKDRFWYGRPPARRGITRLRLGERIKLFLNSGVIGLLEFSEQMSNFDDKTKGPPK